MTTTLEATQQLVSTGSKEVADLEAKVANLTREIDQARAELDELARARQDRAQRLREAHAPVEQTETALTQTSTRAKWAQGTPNEAETVKEVALAKKTLGMARKQYEQQQSEGEKADKAATTREQELRKHIDTSLAALTSQKAELEALQSTHKVAHEELGALKHAALVRAYEEKQRRVEELRDELLSAQVEAHDFHEASLIELAEWPDQARAFIQVRPRNDATIRVIETSLLYIDTLLADTGDVPHLLTLPAFSSAISSSVDVWNKLLIPPGEVIDNIRRSPAGLQARRDTLQKLLDEYRAHLDTQPPPAAMQAKCWGNLVEPLAQDSAGIDSITAQFHNISNR